MKNPFDKEKDPYGHTFFKQMTDAINEWMLTQYPEFDKLLLDKIQQVKYLCEETEIVVSNLKAEMESIKEKHKNYIVHQVNEFLSKEYPDISRKVQQSVIDLEIAVKKHQKNVELMENKLKTVVKSDTLYEDVYKLRDEFKEIQKFTDSFKSNIKKAFKI